MLSQPPHIETRSGRAIPILSSLLLAEDDSKGIRVYTTNTNGVRIESLGGKKMKKELSVLDIESQVAVELPERELLALVNVFITNLLNNNTVTITVRDVNVAAIICAAVLATGQFDCPPVVVQP